MSEMAKIRGKIMNSYDIRRLDKKCNYSDCNKEPELIYDIFEFTLQRTKGIAKLFLCKEHLATTQALMKVMRKSFPEIIIQGKEQELSK